jgi:TolA-binding protein
MPRRDPRVSSEPRWKHGPPRRYGAPRWYRASRRARLVRLAIPVAIAIMVAGFAIGAAVAYFAAGHGRSAAQGPANVRPASHPAPPATRHAHTSRSGGGEQSPGTRSGTAQALPTATTSANGHRLNDEGYALLRQGNYAAAIPQLRKAVSDLAGAGPADPYEAYANYNLGYALVRTGRCTEALAPLEAANRLETSPAVDRTLREARSCAPSGS